MLRGQLRLRAAAAARTPRGCALLQKAHRDEARASQLREAAAVQLEKRPHRNTDPAQPKPNK